MPLWYINTWINNNSNAYSKQWHISRKNSIHKSNYKINYYPGCVIFKHVACFWMCVLFYVSFVCLHVCAYAFKIKVHCWSAFEPGASVLPCYCTPPVCVPDVIGVLAVWRQNNQKNKDMRLAVCFFGVTNSCMHLQNRNLVDHLFRVIPN